MNGRVSNGRVASAILAVGVVLAGGCVSVGLDPDHVYTRIACEDGTADCDARLSTGCETDITSPTACGACGVVCAAGERCSSGRCVR